MDAEIKKEFDDLAVMIKQGFDDFELRMATKEDLKNFVTKEDLKNFATKDDIKNLATRDDLKNTELNLERKMEEGFSSIRAELKLIKERLSAIESSVAQLTKTETEDVGAIIQDIETIKKRVARVENHLNLQTA